MRQGLFLQTGAFVVHIKTRIPAVAHGLGLLYADYSLASNEFADFHVTLAPPRNLRRWLRSQVLFQFEGKLPFKPLPYSQAFPMLEWGLNWCVSNHAHTYLMIHAAVVEKGGRAAILPAPPGSGKSTLCAALINRGWRLLSDELTLIRLNDGLIESFPRPVSLKNGSIEVIKRYVPSAIFSPVVKDTIKGTVAHMKPSTDSVQRGQEPARAAWIIFPKFTVGAETRLEEIPSARAFMRVADNSFNYGLLGQQGFQALAQLIDHSQAFDFSYSELDEAMQVFDNLTLTKQA
ncbi:HprK-related kinase A [Solimicrobium silvestre]|uniref:HprK-related kinase A n=1 Tax=Solimicrobium silvestre TaxID=2099400 RepID=UPI002434A9CF|nr:HprK-related kinase A [Solimicrobium silvestre]